MIYGVNLRINEPSFVEMDCGHPVVYDEHHDLKCSRCDHHHCKSCLRDHFGMCQVCWECLASDEEAIEAVRKHAPERVLVISRQLLGDRKIAA